MWTLAALLGFEAVLAANPMLADQGPTLPAGVIITLPELSAPEPERFPEWRSWPLQ